MFVPVNKLDSLQKIYVIVSAQGIKVSPLTLSVTPHPIVPIAFVVSDIFLVTPLLGLPLPTDIDVIVDG